MPEAGTSSTLRCGDESTDREQGTIDDVPSDPELRRLAYRFGFLCMDSRLEGGSAGRLMAELRWSKTTVGDFALWIHPDARQQILHGAGRYRVFIGDVFDIATGAPPQHAPPAGDAALFAFADGLSGRFALIVVAGERVRILHDPIGSRAVVYRPGAVFAAASHARLLAKATGAGRREDVKDLLADPGYRSRQVRYLPGDWTLYQGIYGLVPNTLYDSDAKRALRYWPRQPLAEMQFRPFTRVIQGYLASLADFVGSRYRPLFGLTGGADSRLLYAAFRERGVPFETMTWRSSSMDAQELAAVERLADHNGVSHRYVDVPRRAKASAVGLIAGMNGGHGRGHGGLAQSMHPAFRTETDLVFIKGHGAEILRGFYNLGKHPMTDAEPGCMARAYGMPNITERGRALVLAAFEEFSERADYAALHGLGYDPNDIFYWEHRMGMWSSNSNNKLDVVMPTLIGFNGRALFTAAFGLPRKRRLTKRLFLKLIDGYDPVLARIPLAPLNRKNRVSLGSPLSRPALLLRRLWRRIRKGLKRYALLAFP